MSGSNRDDLATAFRLAIYLLIGVGFLSVVWQVSGVYAERRQNAEHRARQYADTTERRVADACATVERSAVLECVTEQIEAARQDERTEYDLQAQQDSADAAFWMAWISFFTLAATLVALWFVKRTLDATWKAVEDTGEATDAMREANRLSKDGAERQLRPYVYFGDTTLIRPFGRASNLILKIKNYGSSPALKVRIGSASQIVKRPIGNQARDLKVTEWEEIPDFAPQAETTLCVSFSEFSIAQLNAIRDGTDALIALHAVRYEGFGASQETHELAIFVDKTAVESGDVLALTKWARERSHVEPDAPELDEYGGEKGA